MGEKDHTKCSLIDENSTCQIHTKELPPFYIEFVWRLQMIPTHIFLHVLDSLSDSCSTVLSDFKQAIVGGRSVKYDL